MSFEIASKNSDALLQELESSCLSQSRSYPDLRKRITILSLKWVAFQDLFQAVPDSPLKGLFLSFVQRFDRSDQHV